MIEGNLRDVSLPGLLQFLSAEGNKNFRISVASSGQTGEVYVCKGFVVCAAFGILEGEDAMCEFLSWRDGTFFVEQLTSQYEVKKNLKRAVPPGTAFAEQALYLAQQKVGLTTVLVPSPNFRSEKWQEAVRVQPLEREDFVVVGWLNEGRTMRQAVREFNFDIAQATAILTRLIKTNSVVPQRPTADTTPPVPLEEVIDPVFQRFITTGGQQGAAANLAQAAARALVVDNTLVQDAFISTSFRDAPRENREAIGKDMTARSSSALDSQVDLKPAVEKSGSKKNFFDPLKKLGIDLAHVRASMEAKLRKPARKPEDEKSSAIGPTASGPISDGGSFGPTASGSHWAPVVSSKVPPPPTPVPNKGFTSTGTRWTPVTRNVQIVPDESATAKPGNPGQPLSAADIEQMMQQQPQPIVSSSLDTSDVLTPIRQSGNEAVPPAGHRIQYTSSFTSAQPIALPRQTNSSASRHQAIRNPAGESGSSAATFESASAGETSQPLNVVPTAGGMNTDVPPNTGVNSAAAQLGANYVQPVAPNSSDFGSPKQFSMPNNSAPDQAQFPGTPSSYNAPMEQPQAGSFSPTHSRSQFESQSNSGSQSRLQSDAGAPNVRDIANQSNVSSPQSAAAQSVSQPSMQSVPPPSASSSETGANSDVGRSRTEALPMVTIDIERLLSATFTPTQFGKLALKNPSLDPFRRQTLLDVEAGRMLSLAIVDGSRPSAAVLNSYRYCLDRGYIETSDQVVPLTIDLLLGRLEIDQYLLQRRRITGDQLRDLIEISRKEGVKLTFVLVRSGYLTAADLERLEREQMRFALK